MLLPRSRAGAVLIMAAIIATLLTSCGGGGGAAAAAKTTTKSSGSQQQTSGASPTSTKAASGAIKFFSIPSTGASSPQGITTGPDGNLWFVDTSLSAIGRVTPSGSVTEFPLAAHTGPNDMTTGPDGNIWFVTDESVGRITPAGSIQTFTSDFGVSITKGPDGNLWFLHAGLQPALERVTTAGAITKYPAPIDHGYISQGGVTTGPDGNLWFVEGGTSIGRMTPSGAISEFKGVASSPIIAITTGPDNNLWFTVGRPVTQIGRMTLTGAVQLFDVAGQGGNNAPPSITLGPDGNLWFTGDENSIGRITPSGTVNNYDLSATAVGWPSSITTGPDGNVWFTLVCNATSGNSGCSDVGYITP